MHIPAVIASPRWAHLQWRDNLIESKGTVTLYSNTRMRGPDSRTSIGAVTAAVHGPICSPSNAVDQAGVSSGCASWTWPAQATPLSASLASILLILESVPHLAAAFDEAAVLAGQPTPFLTGHLIGAAVVYPLFGFSVAALALLSGRSLAHPIIGVLGAIGAVARQPRRRAPDVQPRSAAARGCTGIGRAPTRRR